MAVWDANWSDFWKSVVGREDPQISSLGKMTFEWLESSKKRCFGAIRSLLSGRGGVELSAGWGSEVMLCCSVFAVRALNYRNFHSWLWYVLFTPFSKCFLCFSCILSYFRDDNSPVLANVQIRSWRALIWLLLLVWKRQRRPKPTLEPSLEHRKQPLNCVNCTGFGDRWRSRELAVEGSTCSLMNFIVK